MHLLCPACSASAVCSLTLTVLHEDYEGWRFSLRGKKIAFLRSCL
jgi:hypothetical protein